MAAAPDRALLERLRRVLNDQPVTEAELRTLSDQAGGLVRVLDAQLKSSEARLDALTADPESSLRDIAAELHRVESLRPRLAEARSLLADLDARARQLRTAWLLGQH